MKIHNEFSIPLPPPEAWLALGRRLVRPGGRVFVLTVPGTAIEGTSEIYGPVESLPEIIESMVIDLEYLGRQSHMELFVVLRDGVSFNRGLEERIRQAIRSALSPRFLPDRITQAPAIPRTLSGKKQEVPIKKLFLGRSAGEVINRAAMANPECLDWYVERARAYAVDAAKQTAGPNFVGRLPGSQSAVRNLPGSSG